MRRTSTWSAWNTNLAWVRTVGITHGECRALAMRDTDASFQTVFVSRAGSGYRGLDDLRGKRLAIGSKDSAHAAILPLHYVTKAGLAGEVSVQRHDSDVGKHGDTGRSEMDAIRAVLGDQVHAAAIGITTWDSIGRDNQTQGSLEVFWTSPEYSHCNFTALPGFPQERAQPWVDRLMAMDWKVPEHRRILEMEGLRQWVIPNLAGYGSLFEAVDEQKVPLHW